MVDPCVAPDPGVGPGLRAGRIVGGAVVMLFLAGLIEGIFRLLRSEEVYPTNIGNPGEMTILQFAERIMGTLRGSDFVSRAQMARLGGDEFCILLHDQRDDLDAAEVATRCLEVVNQPIDLGQQQWRPHVSIGLARFPTDGQTAGGLLKAADSAMYAAKRSGGSQYRFVGGE